MPLKPSFVSGCLLISVLVLSACPTRAQTIVTVAGTGAAGYSGDGGPATAATLNIPAGIALDRSGNLLIADQLNNVIRKLDVTTGIISTIAGGGPYPGDGRLATAAGLYGPTGLVVDPAGNIIIVEEYGSIVRKIDAGTGIMSTIAGVPRAGFSYTGDGGPATAAGFYQPTGAALDANGNIFIADRENNVVRRIDAVTGIITTAVGHYPGYPGYTGNGGPATQAELDECPRIAFDPAGNMLIGDQTNNVIRKVDAGTGIIHTIAGIGISGYNGNGGLATNASLYQPSEAITDAAGNIYIADSYNNVIRKIDATTGIITNVAGNGLQGYSGDGGPALNAKFFRPVDMVFDAVGNLYIADAHNNVIRKIILCTPAIPSISITQSPATLCTSNPSFAAVAVNGGSSPGYQWMLNGANAGSNSPTFSASNVGYGATVVCTLTSNAHCGTSAPVASNLITVTGALTATLADAGAGCAGDTLRVKASGPLTQITWYNGANPVSTVTSTPVLSGVTVAGNNGAGIGAGQLNFPLGIYLDAGGNIYVADNADNRVQKWAPGATAGVTVGSALVAPSSVFIDAAGNLYVSDMGDNQVVKFPPGATSSTLGIVVAGGNGSGGAANQLNNPRALFVDGAGYLYVVDQYNERVQKFPPGSTSATSGVTVAGRPTALGDPIGIFFDAAGNMYVSEAGYGDVRKFPPGASTGVVVAGGNGAGSAANQLDAPGNIFIDGGGNLFVADEVNNRVQKWAPGATSGVTVAGGNGAGLAANQLSNPEGVYVDGAGNVYASDLTKNSVQKWSQRPVIDTAYITTTPGTYTAALIGNGGCTMTTNGVTVLPIVAPSVSINASAAEICAGASVSFTSTLSNGGTTPVYQWQVNGVNAGSNTASFASTALMDKDVVTCRMTSSAVCPLPATVTSNHVAMTVTPVSTPSIHIAASVPATAICSGEAVNFTATAVNGGNSPVYTWTVNNTIVSGNGPVYSSSTLANGDVVACGLSSSASCLTTSTANSNPIPLTVHPSLTPTVTAEASTTTICAGDAVQFTASVGSGVDDIVYQWEVDGAPVGGNSAGFGSRSLKNGDVVLCRVTGNDGCETGSSAAVVMTVNALPAIGPMADIVLPAGQSVTLSPTVTGDISTYSWSPGVALSDSSIGDPVASPAKTVVYKLTVTTAEGCTASGAVKVEVFGKLRIPNAFTPNGDGRNDVFYVLGGPAGSVIKELAVYDRWGQKVFQVHDAVPADPAFGWNGMISGSPAPPGTYVYLLTMGYADGTKQVLNGTVMLVR